MSCQCFDAWAAASTLLRGPSRLSPQAFSWIARNGLKLGSAAQQLNGELWLHFLIAVGCVSEHAVAAVNDVINLKVQWRRHEGASAEARPADSHHYLSRDARASTPGEEAEGEEAEAEVPPRILRREAKREKKHLLREHREVGAWSPEAADIEARLEFVQGKLDEADRKAYELGVPFVDQHSRWQLVNPDAPGSLFEESLRNRAGLGAAVDAAAPQ